MEMAEVCKLDREGKEDGYSAWFAKFQENVKT